jgi:DNA gyrase/topoisomerase IV subunit A
VLGESEDALLIAESGKIARVTGGELPLVARDRKGVIGIKVEAGDSVARMVVLPS